MAVNIRSVLSSFLAIALIVPSVVTPVFASVRAASLGLSGSRSTSFAFSATSDDMPDNAKAFGVHHPQLSTPAKPEMMHIKARPAKLAAKLPYVPGVSVPGPRMTIGNQVLSTRRSSEAVERFFATAGRAVIAPISKTSQRSVGAIRRSASADLSQLNVTGINRWWSFEEGDIPGVGRWMVNSHWQNLVLQVDDFDVHHKGIDLAFRRTYNSFSGHDYASSDGSTEIGQYGAGWTNTFDAHISTNNCPNSGYSYAGVYGFSIHDIDGARYDYCFNAAGVLVPPAGMEGNNLVANTDGGSFFWTKKNGTRYMFYAPYYSGANAGFSGRIFQIAARNTNNFIQFSYAWNGDASTSANLASITASVDNGSLRATLKFAMFGTQKLLSEVDRPDGAAILYNYDTSGNLVSVGKPASNGSGQLAYEGYGGYHNNLFVNNPRWNATYNAATNSATDGGYVAFQQVGPSNAQASAIQWVGVMNPGQSYLNDGTGTSIQPQYSNGPFQYRYETITSTKDYSKFVDTDGHQTVQYIDGPNGAPYYDPGRPTTRYEWNGTQWLSTTEAWDGHNNLVSRISTTNHETDYAYDGNNNTIAVAAPQVQTSAGFIRPTKLFTYDSANNVLAYCDEVASNALGRNWGASAPAAGSCPSNGSATVATFDYPSYQPAGRLLQLQMPAQKSGATPYSHHFSYDTTRQGGSVDFGLPTTIQGDAIPEDGGRTPTQNFTYDAFGNVTNYNTGSGPWILAYDTMNRLASATDPDGVAATTTYFPSGATATSQDGPEKALGVQSAFTYDADGDVATELLHHGCVASSCLESPTRKLYDGADRLIEVVQPSDTRTYKDGPAQRYDYAGWMTRYLYDLSGSNASNSIRGGPTFRAYGNLFKTQLGTMDVRGNAFDALDRATAKYTYQPGYPNATVTAQENYDTTTGLLTSETKASGEGVTIAYDNLDRVQSRTYSSGARTADGGTVTTPNETYSYDPAGRPASITSSVFGTETWSYDAIGNVTDVQEPSGGGVTSPAHLTYAYFRDGKKQNVSVASSGFNAPNALSYSYRTDGLLASEVNSAYYGATWSKQYSAAGRLTSQSVANDTQTRAYNPAGELATYTLGSGSINYGYDAEGSPTSINYSTLNIGASLNPGVGGAGNIPVSLANTYSVRGELLQSVYSPSSYFPTYSRSLPSGGYMTHETVDVNQGIIESNPGETYDNVNGVFLNFDSGSTSGGGASCNGQIPASSSTRQSTFDVGGRQTQSKKMTAQVTTSKAGCAIGVTTSTTANHAFDAENHLAWGHGRTTRSRYDSSNNSTTTTSTDTGASTIGWGPNGHPFLFTGNAPPNLATSSCVCTSLTAHWDGDTILFLTDANGLNVDYKIGLDGEINRDVSFTGLNTYDRDGSGFVLQTSNTTGNSAMNPLDPTTGSSPYVPASSGYTASTFVPFPYSRSDGFVWNIFGVNSDPSSPGMQISGVRVFDPTLTTWTTPDAYAGEVHDPASQMPYMWNRNNPYVYSDPSGFEAAVCNLSCVGAGVEVFGLRLLGGVGMLLSLSGDTPKRTPEEVAAFKKKESEHTKGARPSTEEKHEQGEARKRQDGGGEKGDANREVPRKKPNGYKGPYPPKPTQPKNESTTKQK